MRRLLIRRPARGQALVEFALIVPVFILLLVGLFDLGRGVYAFNTISNASREAVRVGIVDQNCASIVNEATKQAVSLNVQPADVSVWIWDSSSANAGDFSAAAATTHRRVCGTPPGTAECPQSATDSTVPIGCVIEVQIVYHYSAATPIIGKIVGTFDMSSRTREPIERCFNSSLATPTCKNT